MGYIRANFWIPRYKYQLLLWFKEHTSMKQSDLVKMKYKQLLAIYIKERSK